MFYIECTTYDEHNKSINNFLKENFKNEFKDMTFKINYENRKFILTYKNADLTSIDIENFLSVNTINELDKKKQIKTISLFIKIVDAYAKNFVNYNDNCISALLGKDYDLIFSFKFEFWKGAFCYVYNQSALADGNSLTNENILANIVKDFVYIILKINNAIKAPVDGDIRVTMHSGRYQLFLYQESLVCGMFNFNDINELNIYLKENLLIKNLNIALEKIRLYKEQELKILEATLEQRHLSIKTKEVFLLYKKFGELCASEHLKGEFGINDSNFFSLDIKPTTSSAPSKFDNILIIADLKLDLTKFIQELSFIYDSMLTLINKKIIYIALTIELNKIILYFSEGKFRSHILEVNYNNASDIKEILNNLIFKAVENLSFILNLNQSLEIYLNKSLEIDLNQSLEYYEQFKNRIFELIFEKNEVCLYMTYENTSQKLFSFENFDQKFIINTIIDIESKLNVLKKICYEIRCDPYSPKEIYVPNYLSDMHMFFYFNFNTFKDFKNNLSFKFTDKSEFAADYPEKVHLTISLEWPTEKVLIESLSKFRSIEQFFGDLKKLAKLCDLTDNIINIEVKNNKIIIKIIDDKEYTKGKEYVYDNANLENLHEKILIHLNNWL